MPRQTWKDTMSDFALWLSLLGFEQEVPFTGLSGKRRYRWDFCRDWIAVEYHGFGRGKEKGEERGGHETRAGLTRDREKVTEGQLCGYTVIQCSAETIEDGRCQTWIETALQLRAAS